MPAATLSAPFKSAEPTVTIRARPQTQILRRLLVAGQNDELRGETVKVILRCVKRMLDSFDKWNSNINIRKVLSALKDGQI